MTKTTAKTTTAKSTEAKAPAKATTEAKITDSAKLADLTKAPENASPSPGPKPSKAELSDAQKREAELEDGETATSVRVKLRKDETTTIPLRVFEHEIPILQALFGGGDDNVIEVIEGSEKQNPVGDANAEYERLLRAYGQKGEPVVREIYGSAAALATEAGLRKPARVKAFGGGSRLTEHSSQRGSGVE